MKNIRTQRLFAFLLTAIMILTVFCIAPLSANAEESATPTEPVTTEPSDRLYGDVNGDSIININDATEIQKAIASLVTFTEFQLKAGDVNLDGKTDIVDVTLIQKYLASYDVEYVGTKMPSGDYVPDEIQKGEEEITDF